jgi:NAD(P)-dependent dehydrogenase (short-subunit alcohol dehydrogenase family)
MGRLDGKVAIVTGGGSGMGQATSILWAKEGAKVVVADVNVEGGKQTVQTIKDAGGEATFVQADVSKASDAKKMVEFAVKTYGKLNILFNNAGILISRGIKTADITEEDADKLIAVNFKGVFLGTKYAIPEIIKSGGGSIITTGSDSAFHGGGGGSIYAATKGAVVTFARNVAAEYAKKGIRSNSLSPCGARTPMNAENMNKPDYEANGQKLFPLGRRCEPDDVAYAALFLASDESKYITGSNLMVDGGFTSIAVLP